MSVQGGQSRPEQEATVHHATALRAEVGRTMVAFMQMKAFAEDPLVLTTARS